MYTQILENAFKGCTIRKFRAIVGTIVPAYSRPTIQELAELMNLGDVMDTLAELHDYLTGKSRYSNEKFHIDTPLKLHESV